MRHPFDLSGRTAIVTGASRGIGAATVRALDGAGCRVALVARSLDQLDLVAAELSNAPLTIAADLSVDGESERVAAVVLETFEVVDVLVNNAAVGVRQPTTHTDGAAIDQILNLNVRSLLLLTRALLPQMADRGVGSVVNLSSVSAVVGTPNRAAYAASKAAVDGLTRSLAMEWGPKGVRVNAVAPGAIATSMWEKNRSIPGVIEQIESLTALRRWGTAEDVADVIVFLASDASRYITGATLPVDGGMTTTLDLYGGAV